MTREYSRIFLKVSLVWKQPSKVRCWTSILIFQLSDLSKFVLFHHNFVVSVQKNQIRIVENVPMDHTDHFGFRQNKSSWISNTSPTWWLWWTSYVVRFIRKVSLFRGGNFLKRSLVRGPLEAYIFIFWFWKAHPFQEPAILAAAQSNQ